MLPHTPEIQAIQTVYDGHHFRSRLEARWAVFFNSLKIPYAYEPEGFNLGGIAYLPDFWLPEQRFFFEVKGPFTFNNGDEKARRLANALRQMVYLFGSIPKIDQYKGFDYAEVGTAYYPDDGIDYDYLWCRKRCCGKYGIQYQGRSERISCDCNKVDWELADHTYDHPSIMLALTAARHCRFEKGAM